MDAALETSLREQLTDRRRRLQRAVAEVGEASDLVRLLQEVDGALKRMDVRTFGVCEVCKTSIDDADLVANPLTPYCLCDLSPAQQERLSSDLDLAARLQLSLLPRPDLTAAGYEVHYRYQPLGPVSGDFLDVVSREPDHGDLMFLFGDVSGKGVAASFLMARLNALFRSLVDLGLPVQELVERTNRLFAEAKPSTHYATLVAGRAGKDGAVEVCNAGHCPPLVLRGGEVEPIGSSGFPVGLFGKSPYQAHPVALRPGDTLFLYTDGLTEAAGGDDEQYGVERLLAVLAAHGKREPRQLAQACLEDVRRFLRGAPLTDDLTLMVVRRGDWQ